MESLRSRVAEIEAALQEWAAAELELQRRLAAYHLKCELARQRLRDLTAQVSRTQYALRLAQDRAKSAEARTAASAQALAACEQRLADAISDRARLGERVERELALRSLAEDTLEERTAREAKFEERLKSLAGGLESGIATLSERLASGWDASRQDGEHLLFYVTAAGYEIAVAGGPPPEPNAVVDIAPHGLGLVAKLGPSPLPGDRRWCAYVVPSTAPIPENGCDRGCCNRDCC
jgi:hypothetical protein